MPVERGRTLQLLLRGPEISDKEFSPSESQFNLLQLSWLQAWKDIDFGNRCFFMHFFYGVDCQHMSVNIDTIQCLDVKFLN